VGVLYHKL